MHSSFECRVLPLFRCYEVPNLPSQLFKNKFVKICLTSDYGLVISDQTFILKLYIFGRVVEYKPLVLSPKHDLQCSDGRTGEIYLIHRGRRLISKLVSRSDRKTNLPQSTRETKELFETGPTAEVNPVLEAAYRQRYNAMCLTQEGDVCIRTNIPTRLDMIAKKSIIKRCIYVPEFTKPALHEKTGDIYLTTRNSIHKYSKTQQLVLPVAGLEGVTGNCDGHGSFARFGDVITSPIVTENYLYFSSFAVRRQYNWRCYKMDEARYCRVDLESFEVRTVEFFGLPKNRHPEAWSCRDELAVFVYTNPFQVFVSDLAKDLTSSSLRKDIQKINLEFNRTNFCLDTRIRLKNNQSLLADWRYLVVRCEYFRMLFSSGMVESQKREEVYEIDLSQSTISMSAMYAVLQYIMMDEYRPAEASPELDCLGLASLTLEVREAADFLQLFRLRKLCESFVVDCVLGTNPKNVVNVLTRLGNLPEDAVLKRAVRLLCSHRREIFQKCSGDELSALARKHPSLVRSFLISSTVHLGQVYDSLQELDL